VITSLGGQFTSNDTLSSTSVEFPPNAVDTDITVIYAYQSPQIVYPLGHAYRFFSLTALQNNRVITQFNRPITITVNYSANNPIIKNTAKLYWLNGTTWSTTGITTVNETATQLTSLTDHFTLFAVLGETNLTYLPIIAK
jgi:hypothetical protein